MEKSFLTNNGTVNRNNTLVSRVFNALLFSFFSTRRREIVSPIKSVYQYFEFITVVSLALFGKSFTNF